MKKLLFLLAFSLTAIYANAQTNVIPVIEPSYAIYPTNQYRLPSIVPSQVVQPDYKGGYNVYNTDAYGLPDMKSVQVIVPQYDGTLNVYSTDQWGLRNINPVEIIKIK